MIFSAIIPYGVLPAWMYHIQNPPPTHSLDISVAGIGWVDLVFPIFIFCMGVAIPLSHTKYTKVIFVRFLKLWLFSYLYVLLNYSNVGGFWPQFFTLAGFVALFLVYYKAPVSSSASLRVLGLVLLVAVLAVGHFCFGEVISLHRRGIIIFLLAFLYLFGSLIWYFTRNRTGLRLLIFALLFIFTHITRLLDWPSITYANPNVRWWFNMEYLYFLLLLLPATIVGDLLNAGSCKPDGVQEPLCTDAGRKTPILEHLFYPSMLLFVIWQCYALYMNITMANLVVSLLYFVTVVWLSGRYFKGRRGLLLMAGALIVWGVLFSVIEGGVKKVPCTISYCLVTCGISILLLQVADYICKWVPNSIFVKIFSGAGQNPLMAYVAFDSFMVPLMKATGIITLYTSLYSGPDGNAALGVLRAAAAVLLTMWGVSILSRKGIFWRA